MGCCTEFPWNAASRSQTGCCRTPSIQDHVSSNHSSLLKRNHSAPFQEVLEPTQGATTRQELIKGGNKPGKHTLREKERFSSRFRLARRLKDLINSGGRAPVNQMQIQIPLIPISMRWLNRYPTFNDGSDAHLVRTMCIGQRCYCCHGS